MLVPLTLGISITMQLCVQTVELAVSVILYRRIYLFGRPLAMFVWSSELHGLLFFKKKKRELKNKPSLVKMAILLKSFIVIVIILNYKNIVDKYINNGLQFVTYSHMLNVGVYNYDENTHYRITSVHLREINFCNAFVKP